MSTVTSSEQDYIPDTAVIRNLVDRSDAQPYGTTDQRRLNEAETFYVSTRMAELLTEPVNGDELFTFSRMRRIHQRLFQDVYAWAGDPRRVGMAKLGTHYADPREMGALLRGQFEQLAAQGYLRGIDDADEFAGKLAAAWAEINHGHAFREGNTRSQAVFFLQLAKSAGWDLDVARLAPQHPASVYDEFVDARFAHQEKRSADGANAAEASQELADVLKGVLSPDPSPEGRQRRAGVEHADAVAERHRRFPELRDARLDRFAADEALSQPSGDLER